MYKKRIRHRINNFNILERSTDAYVSQNPLLLVCRVDLRTAAMFCHNFYESALYSAHCRIPKALFIIQSNLYVILFHFCEFEISLSHNRCNKFIWKCEAISSQSHFSKEFQVELWLLFPVPSAVTAAFIELSIFTISAQTPGLLSQSKHVFLAKKWLKFATYNTFLGTGSSN